MSNNTNMNGTKEKKKRGGWNAIVRRKRMSKQVLRGHYEWCKKEGRDVSWYESTTGNEF